MQTPRNLESSLGRQSKEEGNIHQVGTAQKLLSRHRLRATPTNASFCDQVDLGWTVIHGVSTTLKDVPWK